MKGLLASMVPTPRAGAHVGPDIIPLKLLWYGLSEVIDDKTTIQHYNSKALAFKSLFKYI